MMPTLFVLDPCFGAWPTGVLVLFLAGVLLGEALYQAPARRILSRLAIRLVLLALLAALLLRPSAVNAEQQELTPVLAVVLDSSQSLRLPGLDGPQTPPRLDAARELLINRLQPVLTALSGKHVTWELNETLRRMDAPPEKLTDWPAGGGGSALADGLDQLLTGNAPGAPGARCDAVLVLTDGAITRGRGWREMLADARPLAAPVYVFALGNGDRPPPAAFDLGRLQGPDRVKAGEAARYTLALVAPATYAGDDADPPATLRFHWRLDGVELAVHELSAPRHGAVLTDTLTVPLPEPGLLRLTCSLEAPAALTAAAPIEPPETSRLIRVDSARIRVLFWSMQLGRETRRIEEHLARDPVLTVNVANDFNLKQPLDIANALRSADVLVWEAPDSARLSAATLQLVADRLQAGLGLVLISSPRFNLQHASKLLTLLPAQAAAPWVRAETQPVAPTDLRKGPFWRDHPPSLPAFSGRLQLFDDASPTAGYQPVITTAEGRPVLLAGKPAPQTSVAVLLTPDWPEPPPAGSAAAPAGGNFTLGPLLRHTVHWAAGLDDQTGAPRLRLTLTDDRPLPNEPLSGGVELENVPNPALDPDHLQLTLIPQPPAGAPATAESLPAYKPQAVPYQAAGDAARFTLRLTTPGAYVLEARFTTDGKTLTDRVPLFVAGDELEAITPPDHAGLRALAADSGGAFFTPASLTPDDLNRLQKALRERLTSTPITQVARAPFGGLTTLSGMMVVVLLIEMTLRTRRWW